MADRQQPSFRPAEDDPLSVQGLLSISRLQTGEHVVRVGVMSHADFGSIDADLRDTIAANRSKLGEARAEGRETHLVVVVEPHRSPEGAAVPELPPEVDFLWLFLQFEPWLKDRYVWWIRRLGPCWQTAPRW